MPSNAMKLGQFIEQLEALRADHGEIDVVLALPGAGALVAIDGRNVNVGVEAQGQKLPHPVVLVGLWRDQAGRLTNLPGQKYEFTADDSEWNYNRQEAPEDTDLIVHKRYGGRDKGYRLGEKWFVFEGADERPERPIEIIPAGVLGWKLP